MLESLVFIGTCVLLGVLYGVLKAEKKVMAARTARIHNKASSGLSRGHSKALFPVGPTDAIIKPDRLLKAPAGSKLKGRARNQERRKVRKDAQSYRQDNQSWPY